MDEEYGSTFVTITGEDGTEYELEHIDTIEYNGTVYMAFFPVVPTEDGENPSDEDAEEDYGMILMKVIHEDGEDLLEPVEDEDELDAVYQEFMNDLFDEDEE